MHHERPTCQQNLTAERDGLLALGVEAERIYVDHGLIDTYRERPGLLEALAACREGDTLVVTKLDRLARFVERSSQADRHAERDQCGILLREGSPVVLGMDQLGLAARVDEMLHPGGCGAQVADDCLLLTGGEVVSELVECGEQGGEFIK